MKAGQVVPFLGAGASLCGRSEGHSWNPAEPEFLPLGYELAHMLAEESGFPSSEPIDRNDLAKVASYYADISGRRTLRERLREVLNRNYHFGALHGFLAGLEIPQVIVVANYDTLVESAFAHFGKPYDLVIYPADRKDFANAVLWWQHGQGKPDIVSPNSLDIDLTRRTVIFKMHGTVVRENRDFDNFVITEEDYVEFLSRMTTNTAIPALFYPYFRERSFLFLGYSLRDWNLRVVLRNLSKLFASRQTESQDLDEVLPSWAIQRNPSELEFRLWEKRNVNIFDTTLDDFINKLKARAQV